MKTVLMEASRKVSVQILPVSSESIEKKIKISVDSGLIFNCFGTKDIIC